MNFFISSILLLIFSFNVHAITLQSDANSLSEIKAMGEIFFKSSTTSEIIPHPSTLNLPARGEGDISLEIGDKKFVASKFFSVKKNGRVIFYVVFKCNNSLMEQNEEDETKMHEGVHVFRGTYTRGSNMALYYGDVFHKEGKDLISNFDENSIIEEINSGAKGFTYHAGFYFKTDIEK